MTQSIVPEFDLIESALTTMSLLGQSQAWENQALEAQIASTILQLMNMSFRRHVPLVENSVTNNEVTLHLHPTTNDMAVEFVGCPFYPDLPILITITNSTPAVFSTSQPKPYSDRPIETVVFLQLVRAYERFFAVQFDRTKVQKFLFE